MTPEPLLVRMPNWLGDIVMATSALEALHRTGRYELRVLVREPWDSLFRDDPRVSDIVVCRDRWPGILETAKQIRAWRYPFVVDFTHSARSWILWRLAGIPRVHRESSRGPRGARHAAMHQSERYLSVVRNLTFGAPAMPWPARVYAASEPESGGREKEHRDVLLFPGAAYGPAKTWSAAHYAGMIEVLRDRNWPVRIVGTPGERAFLDFILDCVASRIPPSSDDGVSVISDLSITDLLVRIASARAVISCDSGAAHLAAALGCPVVVLFFSTEPSSTIPIGFPVRAAVAEVPCRPCFRRTCPIGYLCRDAVTPDQVVAHLDDLLDLPASRSIHTYI